MDDNQVTLSSFYLSQIEYFSQKIASTIDREADHPQVRSFFVNHEGKKTLTVRVGPSIYGVDYEWFFKEMSGQIKANINKPDYTDAIESDFSSSTPVQKIVNNIMLMYSFQKYFEYEMFLMCGIPGVIMEGSEEDWKNMIEKLEFEWRTYSMGFSRWEFLPFGIRIYVPCICQAK